MFKKISVIMLLVALSIVTASVVSAESRPAPIGVGIKAELRASSTVMKPRPMEARPINGTSTPPKLEAKEGEVVISGKVTAVSGTTINMDVISISRSTTTKAVSTSTVSYTINAISTTKVFKQNGTSTLSSIVVGDVIVVNGRAATKGSTTLTAKVIHDLGAINPLRRAEDMNKSKAKKVGDDDRDGDDDRASTTRGEYGKKKGILNWFKGLFGF